MIVNSWISDKTAKGRPSKISGLGFFATEDISKDEIVAIKGGHIIDRATLDENQKIIRGAEDQITDTHYIAPLEEAEFESSMVFCNHSCEPNLGFGGNILVIAMRDIKAGEELNIDYAMHLSDPSYSMACNCQARLCRKLIKGEDWRDPELQKRYQGYFSWYIQHKIEAL